MDPKILRYAERCLEYEHTKSRYPGGVSLGDWGSILRDCRTYVELSGRQYAPGDWSQQSIDNYKMECIEYRLRKHAAAARNCGGLK